MLFIFVLILFILLICFIQNTQKDFDDDNLTNKPIEETKKELDLNNFKHRTNSFRADIPIEILELLKDTKATEFAEWHTKVAGVTFKNDDGTSRQEIISKLHQYQEVKLVPYIHQNKDAVYVKTLDDIIIGNIPAIATKNVILRLKNNVILKTAVSNVGNFINEKNEKIYYLKICLYLDATDLSKIT